ncbi:unnamed protein product [Cyclocybe aegerita]|uniref:Uncharacterized protein n=1 Tax=Cyclocybe aegerita TaxID=1973307 RepID=A0A8S0W7Z1_CYCAE|nr:unnamed protein product [Cyclocybe aegerita]
MPSITVGNPCTAFTTTDVAWNATELGNSVDELPRRKNLIGKPKPPPALPQSSEEIPNLIEQRRKKQLAPKSLSVSISPFELEDRLAVASAPHSQRSFANLPTTLHTPSPVARTDALKNQPHARKHSVLDGQLSLDIISPTTSVPPLPYSPSSSTSTFSLALDPIAGHVEILSLCRREERQTSGRIL